MYPLHRLDALPIQARLQLQAGVRTLQLLHKTHPRKLYFQRRLSHHQYNHSSLLSSAPYMITSVVIPRRDSVSSPVSDTSYLVVDLRPVQGLLCLSFSWWYFELSLRCLFLSSSLALFIPQSGSCKFTGLRDAGGQAGLPQSICLGLQFAVCSSCFVSAFFLIRIRRSKYSVANNIMQIFSAVPRTYSILTREVSQMAHLIVDCLTVFSAAGWVYAVACFILLQAVVILLQEHFGPTFFLPKGVSPRQQPDFHTYMS